MRVVSFFWKYAVASVAGGVRRAWEKFSPWAAEYALPYAVGALTFCVVAGFHPGKLAVLAAYWVGRWYAAQNLVMKLRSVKLFALGMLGIWLLDASAPIDPIFWGMLLAELGIRAVLYARRVYARAASF